MAIPSWAVDALVRGMGTVVDKVPPERIEQIKTKASQWLDDVPQTAARGMDSVLRSVRVGKDLVKRWAKRHTSLVTPAINASGVLAHHQLQGTPQGGAAIELVSDALMSPPLSTPATEQRLARRLQQTLGNDGWAVVVTSNLNAACLAVAAAHAQRPLVMHRSQSLRLPDGTPIPNAFQAIAGHGGVTEIGSIDRVAAADQQSIPANAVLLSVDRGDGTPPWFGGASGEHQTTVCLMLAASGLAAPAADSDPWSSRFQPPLATAAQRLAGQADSAGLDLVIVSGSGVLGGPDCGLIIGPTALVETIRRSPAWNALRADWNTTALVVQALEALATEDEERHPVLAMVLTSEENLQSRGQRLVTRLTAEESIAECQLVPSTARLTQSGDWQIASRCLRLRHSTWTSAQWSGRLLEGFPAVLTTVKDDTLEIDLRWIPASDDSVLVAALLGEAIVDTNDHPAS